MDKQVEQSLNYEKIYEFRFQEVSPEAKLRTWKALANFFEELTGPVRRVLDPAAGQLEFLRFFKAPEKWSVDLQPVPLERVPGLRHIQGDFFTAHLPENHFDLVFVSNFLEHLRSPEQLQAFLQKVKKVLAPSGKLLIMGPNFKYCASEYFDCADHTLVLTHVTVQEHLAAAGFAQVQTWDRFLPYSFRSRLPQAEWMVRLYLKMPWVWKILGKQFLLVAQK